MASNNDAMGDQDFNFYMSNHKAFWPMSKKWLGIKVTPGVDADEAITYGGAGPSRKKTTSYAFVSDLDSMYNLLLDKDGELRKAIKSLTEVAVKKYNVQNKNALPGEREPTDEKKVIDARSPVVDKYTHKVYMCVLASTWHYNYKAQNNEDSVKIKKGLYHTRIQLKHLSRDFNAENLMKTGGLFIRASDFLHLLRSPELANFLGKLRSDPRVKLDTDYMAVKHARLSSLPILRALELDFDWNNASGGGGAGGGDDCDEEEEEGNGETVDDSEDYGEDEEMSAAVASIESVAGGSGGGNGGGGGSGQQVKKSKKKAGGDGSVVVMESEG